MLGTDFLVDFLGFVFDICEVIDNGLVVLLHL